jgi:hypothetical protein
MAFDISELATSLSNWEFAGYLSLAAVAIGVAGESIHELTELGKKFIWWKCKGGKASALLLIAALAGELIIQIKINSLSGLIIAVLNDGAAKLEKESIQLRSDIERERNIRLPRQLTEEQVDTIANALRDKTERVHIVIQSGLEPKVYAMGFEMAFARAGIKILEYEMPYGASLTGIMVYPAGAVGKHAVETDPLWAALAKAKIYSGYTSTPKFFSTPPNEEALYVGEKSLLLK